MSQFRIFGDEAYFAGPTGLPIGRIKTSEIDDFLNHHEEHNRFELWDQSSNVLRSSMAAFKLKAAEGPHSLLTGRTR